MATGLWAAHAGGVLSMATGLRAAHAGGLLSMYSALWTAQQCVGFCACRIENRFPGGPWRYYCEPTTVGEFWYDDYVKYQLQGPLKAQCGQARACTHALLPLPGLLISHLINPVIMHAADRSVPTRGLCSGVSSPDWPCGIAHGTKVQ
jgi:hypothetical protein